MDPMHAPTPHAVETVNLGVEGVAAQPEAAITSCAAAVGVWLYLLPEPLTEDYPCTRQGFVRRREAKMPRAFVATSSLQCAAIQAALPAADAVAAAAPLASSATTTPAAVWTTRDLAAFEAVVQQCPTEHFSIAGVHVAVEARTGYHSVGQSGGGVAPGLLPAASVGGDGTLAALYGAPLLHALLRAMLSVGLVSSDSALLARTLAKNAAALQGLAPLREAADPLPAANPPSTPPPSYATSAHFLDHPIGWRDDWVRGGVREAYGLEVGSVSPINEGAGGAAAVDAQLAQGLPPVASGKARCRITLGTPGSTGGAAAAPRSARPTRPETLTLHCLPAGAVAMSGAPFTQALREMEQFVFELGDENALACGSSCADSVSAHLAALAASYGCTAERSIGGEGRLAKVLGQCPLLELGGAVARGDFGGWRPVAPVFSEAATGFRVYIGDLAASRDLEGLRNAGVTHVLNCAVFSPKSGLGPSEWAPWAQQGIEYAFLWSTDAERKASAMGAQNLSVQWRTAGMLLMDCRAKGGAALVHCVA